MPTMLDISVNIATGLLGAAVVLVAVRLALGPTLADRALALDLMGFLAVAFAAVFVLRTGHTALFDPAMALALVAFLATVALARFSLGVDQPELSGTGAGAPEDVRRGRDHSAVDQGDGAVDQGDGND
jgi:multicomponent Na+:H+ antiporter subunit F